MASRRQPAQMGGLAGLLMRAPFNMWMMGFYILLALIGPTVSGLGVVAFFDQVAFRLPVFVGDPAPITITTIFVVCGFVAQWLEAVRATRIRGTSTNDILSLFMALISVLLYAGVPMFQTTAFIVVVIVSFGDVLLDRIIGQAVARRDFSSVS